MGRRLPFGAAARAGGFGEEALRPAYRSNHNTSPEPAFAAVIDELRMDGFRLEESVLVYRPARTLVVADLVQNIGRPQHRWTKFYTRTMGFYDRVALSRMIRWAAFSDRAAARLSVDELLTRPFDRVIVRHGTPSAPAGERPSRRRTRGCRPGRFICPTDLWLTLSLTWGCNSIHSPA